MFCISTKQIFTLFQNSVLQAEKQRFFAEIFWRVAQQWNSEVLSSSKRWSNFPENIICWLQRYNDFKPDKIRHQKLMLSESISAYSKQAPGHEELHTMNGHCIYRE